jgi:hypothetical protein
MNEVYDMDKTECEKGSLVKVSGHNKKLQIVIQTDSGQGTQLGIMGRKAETAPINRHLYASLIRFYHSFIYIHTAYSYNQPCRLHLCLIGFSWMRSPCRLFQIAGIPRRPDHCRHHPCTGRYACRRTGHQQPPFGIAIKDSHHSKRRAVLSV